MRRYLQVRWSKNKGFYVENLFVVECETEDDLNAVLEEGRSIIISLKACCVFGKRCKRAFFQPALLAQLMECMGGVQERLKWELECMRQQRWSAVGGGVYVWSLGAGLQWMKFGRRSVVVGVQKIMKLRPGEFIANSSQ